MPYKVKISKAAAQYGRTIDALRAWINRWNRANPHAAIRRHPGYVDDDDLARAMEAWDRQHTPAIRVAETLSANAINKGGEK